MVTINTVSENYFELDGINYPKIYQPLKQGGDSLGIYNIYDTKQQLVNSTEYTLFEINGTVYTNREDTITALLPLLWSENIEVTGNYNAPDNEDIETVLGVLKFKDKPNTVGELGYRIIRSDFDFASIPASYEGCIWEIRYTHDLANANVTIPANVVLLFKGGILTDYNQITLNNTLISADKVKVLDGIGTIVGSFLNDIVHPQWIGGTGSIAVTAKDIKATSLSGTGTRLTASDVDGNLVNPFYGNWELLVLVNSWANTGAQYASARYYTDLLGITHIEGVVRSGTTTVISSIPSATKRPPYDMKFPVYTDDGVLELLVKANGEISISASAKTKGEVHLSVSFKSIG